jgi:2-iminobutanoate/2-iminopropanoate deaminase
MTRKNFGDHPGIFTTVAVRANGFIFTRGTIGTDLETGEMPDTIEAQTKNTLKALQSILEEAGSGLANVVSVNVYMNAIETEFDRMNGAYREYFEERGISMAPVRTTIGCHLPWAKVAIDVVALA